MLAMLNDTFSVIFKHRVVGPRLSLSILNFRAKNHGKNIISTQFLLHLTEQLDLEFSRQNQHSIRNFHFWRENSNIWNIRNSNKIVSQ